VPAAFTVATGQAHWEILLRSRAIETQCYVLAAAQAGVHSPTRSSYGHSMVIYPWGGVVGSLLNEEEGILAAGDMENLWISSPQFFGVSQQSTRKYSFGLNPTRCR